jgi:tRNA pseudouridine55 synthase
VDGVLVIDKPAGWTSHDVVAKVRAITRVKKVGHTGTLDPFATGVLPLVLGRATRLTNYFQASDKVYRGRIRFGFATDTYDVEGVPLGEDAHPQLDAARLREMFARCQGAVRQTLPPYSAKKVNGKPLYDYARKGIEMAPTVKEVVIHSMTLLGVDGSHADFELACAAGCYARSVAHDLGRDYGCGAHLVQLRRIRCGDFAIEGATTLTASDGANAGAPVAEGGAQRYHPAGYFSSRVIPMGELLPEMPVIVVSGGDKERLSHGNDLNLLAADWSSENYKLIDADGALVAVARKVQVFDPPTEQPVRWVRMHPVLTFA